MCGRSDVTFRGTKITMVLGGSGGILSVGGLTYGHDQSMPGGDYDPDTTTARRVHVAAELGKYRKSDLVELLILLIENAEEH